MGFFNGKRKEARAKARAETKAFRGIVAKRKTQAARKAFAEEATKVAAERARAKARGRGKGFGQLLVEHVRGRPVKERVTLRRRTRRRDPLRRRRTTRRRDPLRRRRTTRRRAPVRREAPPRRAKLTQPRTPQTLNEAIFGG